MKKKKEKRIFLDYASTTPTHPLVLSAMISYFSHNFANPSALYSEGVAIKQVVTVARKSVAAILQVNSDEIIFTGNGTEADNLALIGIVIEAKKNIAHPHVVVSSIEHPAILEMVYRLQAQGVEVSFVHPNNEGIIEPKEIQKVLKHNTVLVSVMYANNEIGTIQPIHEIAKIIRHFKKHNASDMKSCNIYFHTDASQAGNYLPLGVPQLGVDMMTLDGSKMYGPKGIGMLYVRRGIVITPQLLGGGQERGLRSGTEFVAGIIGFAKALEIAQKDSEKESTRLRILQDQLIETILSEFPKSHINGSRNQRLPNNINVCFPNIDGEFAVLTLDAHGFAVSSSSSCNTLSDTSRSYVIEALYKKNTREQKSRKKTTTVIKNTQCAESSIRITLGRNTTKKDIQSLMVVLKKKRNIFEVNL